MSAFLRLKRREMEDDAEPNMVPIMNMFMVLIPFLLMSASFYQIKAVNTSIPILAESTDKAGEENPSITLTVIAELTEDSLRLSAMSDKLTGEQLQQYKAVYSRDSKKIYPLEQFSAYLKGIKNQYPESNTLILIPNNATDYNTIIHTMDIARKSGEITLFPNVVLSGSVG